MPLINSLLVRSGTGWSERTDAGSITANSRFEGYLALGAVQTEDGVNAYADAQLDLYATPREEINTGIAPIGDGDTPYIGYQVGDTVTVPDSAGSPVVERVQGITVTENDDTGVAVYSPQFKDFMLERDEQIQIAIKKMSNGSIAGSSQVAQPIRENFVPRDVVALGGPSPPSGTGFDAIIDPDLSADDPTTAHFTTVRAALISLKGGAWATNRVVRFGMKGRFSTSRVTETASILATHCPTGGVVLIGLGGVSIPGIASVQWNLNGFPIGGTLWTVENLEILPGTISAGQGFFSDDCNLTTRNVMFQDGANINVIVGGTGFGQEQHYGSTIFNHNIVSVGAWLYDCSIILLGAVTYNWGTGAAMSVLIIEGGIIEGDGASTMALFQEFVVISAVFGGERNTFSGSGGILLVNLLGGSTQQVMITAFSTERSGSSACAQITSTSANPREVTLVGVFSSINLPAPAVASGAHHVTARLRAAAISGTATITGPATIALSSDTPVTLAGSNVVGNVSAIGNGGATGLTVTAASSMISATVTHTGTAGGTGLNVSGNNNIIDVANAAAFATAVTDTGAGNILRNT